LGLPSYQISSF